MRTLDIGVLGAGVFGVTGALELRARGHAVTLYDAPPLPRADAASTDLSKAVRADYGADTFYTELMERALAEWPSWPEFLADGAIFLAQRPLAPGGFEHDSLATLSARGHPVERLDADTIASRFPAWDGRWIDGHHSAGAGWAESGRVVARLLDEARAAGVRLVPERLDLEAARARHAVVVVAAGVWTPTLLPELAEVMWPTAQTMAYLRVDDPERWRAPSFPVWGADIARTGFYGFPANADGILKVARHGRGERVGPDAPRTVSAEARDAFRAAMRAAGLPEGLCTAPAVEWRRCFYCDTFDGDFWIDRHPGRPGVVVATGGSGHGFKFAPVLGGLVADAVEGRPAPRFAWRTPTGARSEAARCAD